jgi:hypothetical protein
VLNATFGNISAISLQPVLVVEEAGIPGENHRPWHGQATGKLYQMKLHQSMKHTTTQPRPLLRTIFVRLKTNKIQPRPLLRTIFVRHKTNKI